ncbi:MAG: 2-C-methyl-D-erythritol 2,4-cyclodiphosphate synthase [Bacteroidales bacterium]|nr:2-C-methyl-D-erythritol 2,4-cyclodiphosphate synthase [Bacteroidales bacterium]MDD3911690.1 2-C-methyl-D-erythritol 2,4-cyclodiphosphate synthase [Bacteroidales bacterium]MDD4420235.1 2-C-methyl-D-erythritol 2,4-cyclodiphosphate synthase [Bacteroidales bacterium]
MEIRIGNGYDVHLLARGLPLFLGGVKIEHTKGCIAHSDGDVIIHALCDALLGALALGDIGQHFPDTSDEFKGIDSKILLDRTYKMITERGYHLVNADIMLLLQKPKIAPYIVKMRKVLAEVLDTAPDRVSVKATTTEGAGYIGREEGVAAYAVVIISQ